MKVAYSKNYHHFFPRAYLRKKGYPDWKANIILNITIVDDYLNKRKIGTKSPQEYMEAFSKSNSELSDTMKTHLIVNMDEYGIWKNDYERFIAKRGEKVIKEINKRLSPSL